MVQDDGTGVPTNMAYYLDLRKTLLLERNFIYDPINSCDNLA